MFLILCIFISTILMHFDAAAGNLSGACDAVIAIANMKSWVKI
jgi:hypothetical protein